MQNLKKILIIFNKIYIRKIKKMMKIVEKSNLIEECKINYFIAGEQLIISLKEFEKMNILHILDGLRNIYETILIATVLDKNEEIYKAYGKIIKKGKKYEDKSNPVAIRKFIIDNCNEFFTCIYNYPYFEQILNKDILTYIFSKLSNLCSHANKLREIIYNISKNKEDDLKFKSIQFIFLIYPIILIYIDSILTKLRLTDNLYKFVIFYISNIYFSLIASDMQLFKLNLNLKEKYGYLDEDFIKDVKCEKEVIKKILDEIKDEISNKELENNCIEKNIIDFNIFTKKEIEKINNIISSNNSNFN